MKAKIIEYLDSLIPNPKCELNYSKDYEFLIAVMLSAHAKDKMVNQVTAILFKKYPSISSLASANIDDVKEIIKPLGTYNVKASNIISIAKSLSESSNGKVLNDRNYLESLQGVGHKTTNVVLAELFNADTFAVDTHVSRISKRLNIANNNDDVLTIENKLLKYFKGYNINRLHHQLVLFGRYYCKAKKPSCVDCKLKKYCNNKEV